ncbi:MAG: ABC transporter ATP-binding protein [Deltaproteobacteria bacterium RBG_13_47_9]|nr:MAG: ABC transporter ATP-binding protein [Deltaproteobacteria bacterium RBG_13_47_9]
MFMLDVDHIDVYHGDLQALWKVSLQIGNGERVSLIGANGAGKTTIVESISGLLTPVDGSIRFHGVRIDRMPTHKIVELGICLVPEGKGIFPGMSVFENLELGAFIPESRKIKGKTLEFVYDLFPILQSRKNQISGTLSGGEQQMLAIGRALMSKPKLLMLDEPSLGLAPLIVKNIFRVIQQISESGVSILLVEQNVRIALGITQRAYIIENGRVGMHGNSQSLFNDEQVKSAYLGTSRG